MRQVFWVKEESGKYLLLTGVEGDTGYTAQEDLKFLNGYNMGEGKTKKGLFLFPFLHSKILLVFFFSPCFFLLGTPQGVPQFQIPNSAWGALWQINVSTSLVTASITRMTQLDRREHDAPARRVSPEC